MPDTYIVMRIHMKCTIYSLQFSVHAAVSVQDWDEWTNDIGYRHAGSLLDWNVYNWEIFLCECRMEYNELYGMCVFLLSGTLHMISHSSIHTKIPRTITRITVAETAAFEKNYGNFKRAYFRFEKEILVTFGMFVVRQWCGGNTVEQNVRLILVYTNAYIWVRVWAAATTNKIEVYDVYRNRGKYNNILRLAHTHAPADNRVRDNVHK